MLEQYRDRNSLIHTVHARVKIIFTLVFILAVNLTPAGTWTGFILYFSILISIIMLSRLGIRYVLKRSLFALPFILSAIPLIFWGPEPVNHIWLLNRVQVPFSLVGLERCISITLKAWLSVQAAIVLTGTTPFSSIIEGFRQIHVPLILISIIELMWRYLFVIVDEVTRMMRARTSRSTQIGKPYHSGGSVLWRAQVTGNMAGSLFLRSIERSERVYAAMLSRGYTGEPLSVSSTNLSKKDQWITVFSCMMILAVFIFSLFTGR
ncbi:cobalt ECF transporter T component CbiQ [Leptolinea tardivitalis]|uniref:cobalt ECF transporter T component CbiQ n=1 Tax=Leptolinea tardivitalis TaxID=229920 RepID=UPI00078250FC|nr:cobalt ECF transporter T component CbiQ [Leptolinea tardivitalis]GAP20259.1 cobalt ABC transporter, permease protein CbiQ [Leptolinea tardivitalis]